MYKNTILEVMLENTNRTFLAVGLEDNGLAARFWNGTVYGEDFRYKKLFQVLFL